MGGLWGAFTCVDVGSAWGWWKLARGSMAHEEGALSLLAQVGGPVLLAVTEAVPDGVSALAGPTAPREEKAPHENRGTRLSLQGGESQSQSIYCRLGQ